MEEIVIDIIMCFIILSVACIMGIGMMREAKANRSKDTSLRAERGNLNQTKTKPKK